MDLIDLRLLETIKEFNDRGKFPTKRQVAVAAMRRTRREESTLLGRLDRLRWVHMVIGENYGKRGYIPGSWWRLNLTSLGEQMLCQYRDGKIYRAEVTIR